MFKPKVKSCWSLEFFRLVDRWVDGSFSIPKSWILKNLMNLEERWVLGYILIFFDVFDDQDSVFLDVAGGCEYQVF